MPRLAGSRPAIEYYTYCKIGLGLGQKRLARDETTSERLIIGTCAQPYKLMENVSLIRSNHSVSPHFQQSSLRKLLEEL